MPLTNCPDCGAQVSSQAPACASCGCPITAPRVMTIEKTGKKLKAAQIVAVLISLAGLATCCGGSEHGAIGFVLGIVVFIVVKILAWWKHG